jgi:hypothetical protein
VAQGHQGRGPGPGVGTLPGDGFQPVDQGQVRRPRQASVVLAPDGYTYRTRDGSRSAHFEHTILVTDGDPIVLTRRPSEK